MKKLIRLADKLDAIKKMSAANKVDNIIKAASSIKPISSTSGHYDSDKKDNNKDSKKKDEKKDDSKSFESFLEEAVEKITEEETRISQNDENKITLKDLFNM